jgi:molybdate transport system substrate-binding protein
MDTAAAHSDFRVMTSGAFTAAHFALLPQVERLTQRKVVTVTTSIGTGEASIPNRLKRGEVADLVIVAERVLRQFIEEGLVMAEGWAVVARSRIGMAVRKGAPKLDISSLEALKNTLLQAKSVGYSASESGKYLTTELYQRLGIAEQMLPKSRLVSGGERVGAVVARGELEIGFQQMSELLPVAGLDHITPLPPEAQKISAFAAGVGAASPNTALARAVIQYFLSPEAAPIIRQTGLEPAGGQ